MNRPLLFLGKFLRHGTRIASVFPSTRALSMRAVSHIDWQKADVIVELGAGTGPITDVLLQHARPDSRIIAIESDADFAAHLSGRFSGCANIEIIHGRALELQALLRARGISQVNYIVSGLPVPSFSDTDTRDLFTTIRAVLASGGAYSQITELPLLYWNFYRRFFRDVTFSFEPWNIPPGGVYYCRDPLPYGSGENVAKSP